MAADSVPSPLLAFGPELLANPYPFYQKLRSSKPVAWFDAINGWVLTRHADISAVLRDTRFSSKRFARGLERESLRGNEALAQMFEARTKAMLSTDAPTHTRLRSLVSKAFTPRAVEALRPKIAELVDTMLSEAQARGSIDIMRDIAGPLPVYVIAVMLGIPHEDRDRFKHWSDAIAAAANLVQGLSDETLIRSAVAYQELTEYFRALVGRMRAGQGEGVLAAMAAAEEQGDRLTEAELYANAVLLLNAGHETTTNLIGNGTLALLQHPDQWKRLAEKPELIEDGVEELLRYDSPVQFTSRSALEDLEIGGQKIAAGQIVMVLLGAANRDPEAFPDPDRLDLSRAEARHHVAFGQGPHYCLGAPLARLEGEEVFKALVRRFPGLRLEGETPTYRSNFNLRGLVSLPVAV